MYSTNISVALTFFEIFYENALCDLIFIGHFIVRIYKNYIINRNDNTTPR